MKVLKTTIPNLLIIEPQVHHDDRGYFLETFQAQRYREFGIPDIFLQDNHSFSNANVLRGLHFQVKKPQAQMVYVSSGAIFDVAVDLRKGSPTLGRWFGAELSASNGKQLYMPPGFAHGFCVTGIHANVHYKVTEQYCSGDEGGIVWNDPTLAIKWPIESPFVSERDSLYPRLTQISGCSLPHVKFSDSGGR
jgi:dTDP-4-dehydrorhamnose 3,5-epimerase